MDSDPINPASDALLKTISSSRFFTAEMKIFCASNSLTFGQWLSILQITTGTKSGYHTVSVWRNSNDNRLWFGNPMGKNNFGDSFGTFDCEANSYNTWKIIVRPEGNNGVAELFKDGVLISTKTKSQVFKSKHECI